MVAHLKRCEYVPTETLTRIARELQEQKENQPPATPHTSNLSLNWTPFNPTQSFSSPQSSIAGPSTFVHASRPLKRKRTVESDFDDAWTERKHAEFSEDMCRLFIACGIAWNSADNPEMRLFLEKWIPGVRVPGRRVLAGRLLDGEVEKIEAKTRDKVNGKDATIQCDGWKNVAKTPVTTSVMTVEREVSFMYK